MYVSLDRFTEYVWRHSAATAYNVFRPHQALEGATPQEIFDDPNSLASPPLLSRRSKRRKPPPLELKLSYLEGRTHLPIVELKRAA